MDREELLKIDMAPAGQLFTEYNPQGAIALFTQALTELKLYLEKNEDDEIVKQKYKILQDIFSSNLYDFTKKYLSEGRFAKAYICCQTIMKHISKKEEVYRILGDYYKEQGDKEAALKYYETYIEHVPQNYEAIINLLKLYDIVYEDKYLKKQLSLAKQACKLNPEISSAYYSLVNINIKLENYREAEYYFKKLRAIDNTQNNRFWHAAFLIQQGKFQEGFKEYEARFHLEHSPNPFQYLNDNYEKWDGKEDISDKVLLVHSEQGNGDNIMFYRFMPMFKKVAKKVIFMTYERLMPLFKCNDFGIEIVPVTKELEKIKFDRYIYVMDAAACFGLTTDTIPLAEKYIDVPQNAVEEYREKHLPENNKIKIGIGCGYSYKWGATRDIPFMEIFPFAKIEGSELYSFQVGETSMQLKDLPQGVKITDLSGTFNNFLDTAAAMKNMDVMICADNVLLNLAGAMGVKTYGLYNKYKEYRWFKLDGEDVGWYKSVKPFHLKHQNEWTQTVQNVCEQIKKDFSLS